MALQFESKKTIAAPADRVFAAMTQTDEVKQWMPNLVAFEPLTDGPLRAGSQWRETRKMFGKAASEVFEVTSFHPPKHLALRVDGTKGSSKKGEYRFDYQLAPQGANTELTMRGEIRVDGWFSTLMAKLFAKTFIAACAKDLDAMKRWVESGPAR
jgi:uncharacterized protein YndB with AHSA1/START domain